MTAGTKSESFASYDPEHCISTVCRKLDEEKMSMLSGSDVCSDVAMWDRRHPTTISPNFSLEVINESPENRQMRGSGMSRAVPCARRISGGRARAGRDGTRVRRHSLDEGLHRTERDQRSPHPQKPEARQWAVILSSIPSSYPALSAAAACSSTAPAPAFSASACALREGFGCRPKGRFIRFEPRDLCAGVGVSAARMNGREGQTWMRLHKDFAGLPDEIYRRDREPRESRSDFGITVIWRKRLRWRVKIKQSIAVDL
ncbi:hypothetical protein DFH07DRAFT_781137 [Mycena maculata]|uniref:Uncharacterized protein n=1 Tax=Mycena maculata TaxID=230809 RepID=A0AAD7I0F6_9AGAR|nr:hypothetical protein DFH07DRAFT_781137 [Mycena maculata]